MISDDSEEQPPSPYTTAKLHNSVHDPPSPDAAAKKHKTKYNEEDSDDSIEQLDMNQAGQIVELVSVVITCFLYYN